MRCKRIERLTLWGAWTIEYMVVEMRMACERMRARLSNWTCEPMNLWILESISQCINEAVTHWTNKRVNQWINLINEEKMNGWVNQWIMKSLSLESGNLFLHGNGQARFKDNSPHDKDKQFFSASIMNRFFFRNHSPHGSVFGQFGNVACQIPVLFDIPYWCMPKKYVTFQTWRKSYHGTSQFRPSGGPTTQRIKFLGKPHPILSSPVGE
jgi:hypothetical protein